MLSTYGEPCGIATYCAQLHDCLVQLGHDVTVYPIDSRALAMRARAELAGHFAEFIAGMANHDGVIIQHEYGLYDGGYDTIASNETFGGVVAAARRSGKPTLVVFHSDPQPLPYVKPLRRFGRAGRLQRSWQRIVSIINTGTKIRAVVHGRQCRRDMVDSGLRAERIRVIDHPIPAPFGAPRPDQPSLLGDDTPVMLTIFGFVSRYKGYETALRAMLHLPSRFHLTIAGGPHPRAITDTTLDSILSFLATGDFTGGDLAPLAAADRAAVPARLAGRVTLTGYLDDSRLRPVLAGSDIVLAPYGLNGPAGSGAVSWALAAGKPVIATRTRTFLEIHALRPCLSLVTANAPFELARAIVALADDPAERARLQEECAIFARGRTWMKIAGLLVADLAALSGGRSPAFDPTAAGLSPPHQADP